MRQIVVIIWVILAIVSSGASILLALDLLRPRTRMGKYWGLMLAADAAFGIVLIIAIVMARRDASTASVIAGLSLLLIGQGFKTATAGACALHMRANLNGSGKHAKPEAKSDPE